MSYPLDNDPQLIPDLLRRKEFYQYKINNDKNFINKLGQLVQKYKINGIEKILKLSNYQLFANNFINPNTPYKRFLLLWSTGSGKTLAMIAIAMNFIQQYKAQLDIKGDIQNSI